MIQNLVCLPCAERQMRYPDDMDPDFNSSWVEGVLKQREIPAKSTIMNLQTGELLSETEIPPDLYICDSCNRRLMVGDRAVAWTMWPVLERVLPWWESMLTDLVILKEVIRR